MRVVLDTNILARISFGKDGPAAKVWLQLLAKHSLVTSDEMLSELDRVLRYEHIRALHRLDEYRINEFVESVRRVAEMVEPELLSSIAADPDDDVVIATAIAGDADVVCTLDRHLRAPSVQAFCLRQGIRVLTDVELLKELAE